uniref:Chemotaxis phosphatase CheX-like domain-containing protein n=1 Tax=Desulfatirhabdium butyrativorans TaxID=340467 RepID=A0A7C4MR39_9BACT
MTAGALNATLMEVASEMLESLAFMFSTPDTTDFDPPESDAFRIVTVEFDGPFSGALVLMAAEETLPELTASMLGVEETEISSEQKEDALKETLNVVCGNLLPRIAGKEAVFDIARPISMSRIELEALLQVRQPMAKVLLDLDAGSWMFWLFQRS